MQKSKLTIEQEDIIRQIINDINIESEASINLIAARTRNLNQHRDYEIEKVEKEVDKILKEFMEYLSYKTRKISEIIPNLFQFDEEGIVIIPQL